MKGNPHVNIPRMGLNACFILLLLGVAYSLKAHYSHARGEALGWILRPTAGLVETATGIEFTDEGEEGYLSREARIRIAPSCAGVNFLIISLLTATLTGLFRFHSLFAKLGWLMASGVLAYGMTLLSNTVRITLSIHAYRSDIYSGWITPERVHRMEGIVVYLLFLCLFHVLISRLTLNFSSIEIQEKQGRGASNFRRMRRKTFGNDPRLILVWYLAVVLVIPIINGAFQKNPLLFLEHGLTILVLSAICYGLATILQRACRHRKREIV